MNSDVDSLSFISEIWRIPLPEETAIKFNDLRSQDSLASSKAESIRLTIKTLKFLIIQLEQVDAFS